MNVVPVVTGPCVAGKDQADETFFESDRLTDFELRFVRTACDGSMWRFLHLSIVTYQMLPGLVWWRNRL